MGDVVYEIPPPSHVPSSPTLGRVHWSPASSLCLHIHHSHTCVCTHPPCAQLVLQDSDWLTWKRLLIWLWRPIVRGSSLCLFIGLPLGYFYEEADGLFRTRRVIKRFLVAALEVILFGAIVLGIASMLQVRGSGVLPLGGCMAGHFAMGAYCR